MVTFIAHADTRHLERGLDNLILLLSAPGMMAFLGVNVGPYLARRAGARFASEGDDVTGPWAPLRPATIAIRESEGYGAGPINHRTGELEEWVTGSGFDTFPTGLGASLRFPGTEPQSSELRKKLRTAQLGDEASRTVKRPVLGVNERDLLYVQTSLAFAVEQSVKKA